jgi:hypothetical protein
MSKADAGEGPKVDEVFAALVRSYLREPESRESLQRDLCASLCRLLEVGLVNAEGWDYRFMWLDGLVPREIRTSDEGLVIEGGVFVMNGQVTSGVWPLRAEIRIDPASDAVSVRNFFGDLTPRSTPANKEGRFDVRRLSIPRDWRFTFKA